VRFRNVKDLFEFVDNAYAGHRDVGQFVVDSMGRNGMMFEGQQWMTDGRRARSINADGTYDSGELRDEYNPDARSGTRVTDNHLTRLTERVGAKTYPERIYIRTDPPPNDYGPTAAHRASVHATVANAAIDDSGYLEASILANHRRTIFGTWGLGLTMPTDENGGRTVRAFDFDPSCLILDPYQQSPFLTSHLWVMFCETWPVEMARALLPGVNADWDKAVPIEQLEPTRIEWSRRSGGRLWARYAHNSRSKGCRVWQLQCRDPASKRFEYYYVLLEIVKDEKVWVNEDSDHGTPFGGTGLAMTLLHAHQRADSVWSWGEPAQLGDDQRRMNLVQTMKTRALRAWTDPPLVVHRDWFKSGTTDAEIEERVANRTRNVLVLDRPSDRQRPLPAPGFMNYPAVPAFLSSIAAEYVDSMRLKSHLSPGNEGFTQTHVPFSTTSRVLDEADQIASVRVSQDVLAHEELIRTLHATTCRLASEGNGPTLGMLREAGLDDQDFAVVVGTDWRAPQASIVVQEASFRHRSSDSRKQDLNTAAQLGMIDAQTYQNVMATDLQSPLADEDRQMAVEAQKTAIRVLYGEEYEPEPWGRWANLINDALLRALRDRRAQGDPAAKRRLQRAIVMQTEMNAAMAQLAMPPQETAAPSGASDNQNLSPVAPASVSDILDSAGQAGA